METKGLGEICIRDSLPYSRKNGMTSGLVGSLSSFKLVVLNSVNIINVNVQCHLKREFTFHLETSLRPSCFA